MNYFAHARNFLDDPFYATGTAIPDWLGAMDRKVRVHTKGTRPFLDDPDPRIASLAGGIIQHLQDDAWFHANRAFCDLMDRFTGEVKRHLPEGDRMRPSFVGHILVELLLDAELIAEEPPKIERYYEILDTVDHIFVADAVGRIAGKPAPDLARFIRGFSAERFLPDYLEDEKLCFRLNQVMRRVKLERLPSSLVEMMPAAREAVRARKDDLLNPRLET